MTPPPRSCAGSRAPRRRGLPPAAPPAYSRRRRPVTDTEEPSSMNRPESSFWDAVDGIRERDPAYGREAYGFVVAALGVVAEALPAERRRDRERRHLTGAE